MSLCLQLSVFHTQTAICSDLPQLENGAIQYSTPTYIVGTQATHSCLNGYSVTGATVRSCVRQSLSVAVWSGTPPVCTSELIL